MASVCMQVVSKSESEARGKRQENCLSLYIVLELASDDGYADGGPVS